MVHKTLMLFAIVTAVLGSGNKDFHALKLDRAVVKYERPYCILDTQCGCPDADGRCYICKLGTCTRLTIQDIINRQPCPKVYKSYCEKDEDCPCKTTQLMCEENECVRSRTKTGK